MYTHGSVVLCILWLLCAAVEGRRFDALGVVHMHFRGLTTRGCDASQQHCSLMWDESGNTSAVGNLTLEYVRTSLDPPRVKESSNQHTHEPKHLDMQCFVGRHKYSTSNAYHLSESLHALAAELHRVHGSPNSVAMRPTQSHHRLKRLVQQRVEQQQHEDDEDEVLQDLERDVSDRFFSPHVALFRNVIVSSASPAAPFRSPVDADRAAEQQASDGLDPNAQLPLTAFHGIPGSPAAPQSSLHDAYTVAGDLVVARYIRTNNWKYCRNVQHGLFFNMSHRSTDDPFFENRCLVSQWLTDACWMMDVSETDPSRWAVVGGCASNSGAAFQYSALRDARNDAHARTDKSVGNQWVPLTVRICLRTSADRQRQGNSDGLLSGASFTAADGVVMPSFEFMRRLVLDTFEQHPARQGGLRDADKLITLDWRDATYSGVRVSDPVGFAALWWSLGGFVALMLVFVLAVRWC